MRIPNKFTILSSRGIAHFLFPMLVFVLLFAIAGGYFLLRDSHAATADYVFNSGVSGKCLDALDDSTINGTTVDSYNCNKTAAQQWNINSNGTIENANGKCLDNWQDKNANGNPIKLYTCSVTDKAQQWQTAGNLLKNPVTGKCIDDPAWSTVNGKPLELYTCNGGSNQKWTATKINTSAPTPITTPANTTPTTSSTTTGLLRPYGLGLAPYYYIPYGGSMTTGMKASGVSTYFAAFIQDGGSCVPTWDGNSALGLSSSRSSQIDSDITSLRAAGGNVVVSFGGESGTELAASCSTPASLASAYASVVSKYNLTMIDFDLEGGNVSNTTVDARRASALKILQGQYPSLKIFVTLAVDPSNGLEGEGTTVLKQLSSDGVTVTGVNIMVMDYGSGQTDMGQDAITTANVVYSQLKAIYPSASSSTIWRAIGLIPMIGVNDTAPEVFTLANASQLHAFAIQNGIGLMSYWSFARDQACPSGTSTASASDSCSGVSQTPYQFAKTLSIPALH